MPGPILRPIAIAIAAATILAVAPTARAAVLLPDFSAATFVPDAPVTNPYFSLLPGTTAEFRAEFTEHGKSVVETGTRSDLCAQCIVDAGHDQLSLRAQSLAYQLPFTHEAVPSICSDPRS